MQRCFIYNFLLSVIVDKRRPLIVAKNDALIPIAENTSVNRDLPRVKRAELMAPQIDDLHGPVLAHRNKSVLVYFRRILTITQ